MRKLHGPPFQPTGVGWVPFQQASVGRAPL